MAVTTLASRKRVDPNIRRVGKKNGLKETQINFIHYFLCDPDDKIRNNAVRSYLKAYPSASYETAISKGSTMLRKNEKVIKTIDEVLEDVGITRESTLKEHKKLIKDAHKDRKYSAAVAANRDLMEATGALKHESTVHHEVVFDLTGLDKMSDRELSDEIDRMLGAPTEYIEGEYEEV